MRCAARRADRRRRAARPARPRSGARSRSSCASTAVIAATSRSRAGRPLAGSEAGQEVDRRGGAGEQLVGQRAQLEALRHGVGGGQQLVRAQRLQQRRGRRRAPRSAGRGTCRASRRRVRAERGHVDRRVRGQVDAVDEEQRAGPVRLRRRSRGTAGRVPIRFDAPVTATSRVRVGQHGRDVVELGGGRVEVEPTAPSRRRARRRCTHGRMLASWSSRVTTTSSPGPQPAASVRARSKVSAVMLRPNTIPRGSAPSRSAIAGAGASDDRRRRRARRR